MESEYVFFCTVLGLKRCQMLSNDCVPREERRETMDEKEIMTNTAQPILHAGVTLRAQQHL